MDLIDQMVSIAPLDKGKRAREGALTIDRPIRAASASLMQMAPRLFHCDEVPFWKSEARAEVAATSWMLGSTERGLLHKISACDMGVDMTNEMIKWNREVETMWTCV